MTSILRILETTQYYVIVTAYRYSSSRLSFEIPKNWNLLLEALKFFHTHKVNIGYIGVHSIEALRTYLHRQDIEWCDEEYYIRHRAFPIKRDISYLYKDKKKTKRNLYVTL